MALPETMGGPAARIHFKLFKKSHRYKTFRIHFYENRCKCSSHNTRQSFCGYKLCGKWNE